MNRTNKYLNLANNFSELVEQMRYYHFTLTLRPQITVINNGNIQIRFRLTLDDAVLNRSVDLTDKKSSITADADIPQLLEWTAALRHQHRPAGNAAYILENEESILNETVGTLLDKAGSPVAKSIRNWWKNFATKISGRNAGHHFFDTRHKLSEQGDR